MTNKWRLIVATIIIISIACGYFGRHVPFLQQWPLFEALRATAAIIFAVVGAWFAIIYPERLKKSFRGGVPDGDPNGVHRLFTPIVHSTAILSSVLIIGVAAPILKHMSFVVEHKEIYRGISYGVLTLLTQWQLLTVIYSLVGPDIVKRYTSKQEITDESVNAIMPKRNKNK
ncbi:TPA: hypothetical protein ACHWKL_003093 [Providencia stuartii]|uniref:hypothetical protein n=1 Tax=Providencia stuartii TaxID=588 RepID=UPI00114015B8|nr:MULTISPECIES: hypothetical protein [Providencia]MBN5562628.1 hypothetical protein [Providencia stuartii]MBN5602481.1 hypothetical protein [Providencia stuartii]MBN5606423.1 hypothetical protein [Providencia stuartii]MCL8325137.1 hypothetical protein [Providencia thailandensis]MDF4174001.1 hypothetical protein [Providencia thailandensis]